MHPIVTIYLRHYKIAWASLGLIKTRVYRSFTHNRNKKQELTLKADDVCWCTMLLLGLWLGPLLSLLRLCHVLVTNSKWLMYMLAYDYVYTITKARLWKFFLTKSDFICDLHSLLTFRGQSLFVENGVENLSPIT